MIKFLSNAFRSSLRDPAWRTIRRIALAVAVIGGTIWSHACISSEGETYGPYFVIGYNYTDRDIFVFSIDGHGVGSSNAHEPGGGGGIFCCHSIPKDERTMHIKVVLGLTKEQYEKDLPNDTFETDVPVPTLQDKRNGYIELHFLPNRRVEAAWVKLPTIPHIPNAR
jgi:hypothetical protein